MHQASPFEGRNVVIYLEVRQWLGAPGRASEVETTDSGTLVGNLLFLLVLEGECS